MRIEERLDQLEIRYTYLEDKIQTLNDLIIERDREITGLKKQISTLEESIADSFESPRNEKPPHY